MKWILILNIAVVTVGVLDMRKNMHSTARIHESPPPVNVGQKDRSEQINDPGAVAFNTSATILLPLN
jgi:hypothetical protein